MAVDNDQNQKRSLLIVDDEKSILALLEKILERHYDVKKAANGEEALLILQKGFKPGVILCDLHMPGISGAEFLEKSISISPFSSRIIITALSSPKEIIPHLNRSKALFYITKPTEEIELIQAVKLGMEFYNLQNKERESSKKISQLEKEVIEKTESNKNAISDLKLIQNLTIQSISTILNFNDSYYFTNHINSVTIIVKDLIRALRNQSEINSVVVLASLIHPIIYSGMPIKFQLKEITDLDEYERNEYKTQFYQNLSFFSKYKFLQEELQILYQIWEHYDGTGFPNSLTGTQISKEASILAISNFYHNSVYRITYSDFQKFLNDGYLVLTGKELYEKHNETIKAIYRKASWFDLEVFNAFIDLIKSKSCSALNPDFSKDLELKYKNHTEIKELLINANPYFGKSNDEIEEIEKKKKQLERIIEVDDLMEGMTISRAIVSNQGVTLCKQGSILDKHLIKNIINMFESDLIENRIYIEPN